MRSFAIAAQVAALASLASAQNACGAGFTCPGGAAPLQAGPISICLNTAPAAAISTPLLQSQLTGVANEQACATLCQGTTACKYATFVAATGTCLLSGQTLLAADLTGLTTSPGSSFLFILPQCPVSSSSVASSAGSSSSAAAAGTSAPVVVASTSAAAGVSSAASGASSVVVASSVSSAAPSASASAAARSFPICPQDNLATFTASTAAGNSVFSITCGAGTVGKMRRSLPAPISKRQIPGAPLNAFGICITACANVATCQSVLFNPLNGACVLFDCIIPVPAGLSGAIRITSPGGAPFVGTACPARTPTTIPAQNNNGTAPVVFNLNLNIDVDVEVNVLAGEYKGVPYTQICRLAKCKPCDVCTKKPVDHCSVCEQKGKESPLKPSNTYCPPGEPGQKDFPATCKECEAAKNKSYPEPASPAKPAKGGDDYSKPTSSGDYSKPSKSGDDYSKPSSDDYSKNGGKYTGPYSNDAAGLNAMSALIGGAAALAFALA